MGSDTASFRKGESHDKGAIWAPAHAGGLPTWVNLQDFPDVNDSVHSGMGDNSRMSAVLIVEDSENSAAMLEIAFLGIPGVSVLMAPSAIARLMASSGVTKECAARL